MKKKPVSKVEKKKKPAVKTTKKKATKKTGVSGIKGFDALIDAILGKKKGE